MADNSKVEFRVDRVTVTRRQCSVCGGTGKRDKKTPVGFISEPCIHCQNGIMKFEHITSVNLLDALTELGIRFVLPASMKPKD